MNIDGGGDLGFGPQSDTVQETLEAPGSGRQPILTGGGNPAPPATSVQPKALHNLLEALHGASIDEEHRTLMSMVIEKVRSAKSGLTETCASLLTGFKVSNKIVRKYHSIDSSP